MQNTNQNTHKKGESKPVNNRAVEPPADDDLGISLTNLQPVTEPEEHSPQLPEDHASRPQPLDSSPRPQPFGSLPGPRPFGSLPEPRPFGSLPGPPPFGSSRPPPSGSARPQPFGSLSRHQTLDNSSLRPQPPDNLTAGCQPLNDSSARPLRRQQPDDLTSTNMESELGRQRSKLTGLALWKAIVAEYQQTGTTNRLPTIAESAAVRALLQPATHGSARLNASLDAAAAARLDRSISTRAEQNRHLPPTHLHLHPPPLSFTSEDTQASMSEIRTDSGVPSYGWDRFGDDPPTIPSEGVNLLDEPHPEPSLLDHLRLIQNFIQLAAIELASERHTCYQRPTPDQHHHCDLWECLGIFCRNPYGRCPLASILPHLLNVRLLEWTSIATSHLLNSDLVEVLRNIHSTELHQLLRVPEDAEELLTPVPAPQPGPSLLALNTNVSTPGPALPSQSNDQPTPSSPGVIPPLPPRSNNRPPPPLRSSAHQAGPSTQTSDAGTAVPALLHFNNLPGASPSSITPQSGSSTQISNQHPVNLVLPPPAIDDEDDDDDMYVD
ncbi:hypothetical protein BKA70DRAFT_1450523 [Coprinopsis sp. MPI-PUGE-AT-0042]|nr:hypothetical protein BKA70DRAFT_1450523 [Coprinopsis sp. MPI-PUGE-AT-0042]